MQAWFAVAIENVLPFHFTEEPLKVLLTLLSLCVDIVVTVSGVMFSIKFLFADGTDPRIPGLLSLMVAMYVVFGIKEVTFFFLIPDYLGLAPRWYRRLLTGAALAIRWAFNTVVCIVRGHDLEPEVTKITVLALPSPPPCGPPTTAYRRPADDGEPQLGLVVRRGRHCLRCKNTVTVNDSQS